MLNKWVIGQNDENKVKALTAAGLCPLAAAAMVSAGMDTPEKAAAFFGQSGGGQEGTLSQGISDPFSIKDMDAACEVIRAAVDEGRHICVYGDYDCDGITATALLTSYLEDIGALVTPFINERSDGYGMNCDNIRRLKEDGTEVIITVDNGISCHDEARLCRELGVELVITDHHMPGETLPEAAAVVDPHRADCPSVYKNYCGCGIALMLVAALEDGDVELAVEQYSDIAAIATVGDVVPLDGENRLIVRHGLHFLENTENEGLRALMERAGLHAPFNSRSVAFGIVPRINAAGRIGSPFDALAMLRAETEEEADRLAEKICGLNEKRKSEEDVIMADVMRVLRNDPSITDKRIAVIRGEGWNHGVIGIAAARCVTRFGRPVFLMTDEEGGMLRGSARSVEGFNIFEALSHCSAVLDKFGGHKGAGGFSLPAENFGEFDRLLQEYAESVIEGGGSIRDSVAVCKAVTAQELTVENVEGLEALEPFGEGNPRPLFLLADCRVEGISPLSGGAHSKLTLSVGGMNMQALKFRASPEELPCKRGDTVNVLISPEINEYNGRKSVTVRIEDIRRQGLNQSKLMAAEEAYGSFRRGRMTDKRLIGAMLPKREDLAAVYKVLSPEMCSLMRVYSFALSSAPELNYCKFLICLDVFAEAGLAVYDRAAGTVKAAAVIPGTPKADLAATGTMIKLRGLINN